MFAGIVEAEPVSPAGRELMLEGRTLEEDPGDELMLRPKRM